jgi:hypothetical protein
MPSFALSITARTLKCDALIILIIVAVIVIAIKITRGHRSAAAMAFSVSEGRHAQVEQFQCRGLQALLTGFEYATSWRQRS